MVDSIRPRFRGVHAKASASRNQRPNEVESHEDERPVLPKAQPVFYERRRTPDRRKGRLENRGPYCMRANRGRRRSDRGGSPSIEIKV